MGKIESFTRNPMISLVFPYQQWYQKYSVFRSQFSVRQPISKQPQSSKLYSTASKYPNQPINKAPQNQLNSLINPKPPKLPIRLRKCVRSTSNKVRTTRRTVIHIIIVLRLRSQLPAQSNVGNDTLVVEVRGNFAFCAGKISEGCAPG